jgi:hypothetical protein
VNQSRNFNEMLKPLDATPILSPSATAASDFRARDPNPNSLPPQIAGGIVCEERGARSNHTVVSPESEARVAPAAPAGAHHV